MGRKSEGHRSSSRSHHNDEKAHKRHEKIHQSRRERHRANTQESGTSSTDALRSAATRKQKHRRQHTSELSIRSFKYTADPQAKKFDNQEIILPLSAFIDNRSQMVEEMFASLSREELRQLLPDSLTHIQRAELMDLCTDELEGMSKKRITAVLEGRQLMESSDSEESALLDSNEQLSSQTEVDAVHADSSTNVHAELDDTLLNIPNEFTSSETDTDH